MGVNFLKSAGIATLVALSLSPVLASAQTLTLKKNQVYKLSGSLTCGYTASKKKWLPIKKSGKSYVVFKKASSDQKTACSSLLKPSKSISLTKIPDASNILKSAIGASRFGISAVSGTPPTLPEIASSEASSMFWRSGVVDTIATGTPTETQCGEFFSGIVDGESGGYSACYMTQGVGYSMGSIAQSGTSLCYMKNFPTKANQNAGAVRVVSGSLPNNKIEQVFSTPTGSAPRLVKIRAGGGEEESIIYIKVYSEEQNIAQGNQYRYDIWFCDNGPSNPPQEYEQTRVTAGGELITTARHTIEGSGEGFQTVRGFLAQEGSGLVYDSTKERTATYGSITEGDRASNMKSLVVVSSNNEIRSKVREQRGEEAPRFGYSVSSFLGTNVGDLRFLEGAYKESNGMRNFSGATEYRDSLYVAAPSNTYSPELDTIDFASDSFYSSGATLPETKSFSCSASPNITLALDMSAESMIPVSESCEGTRMENLQFCQSETLQAAQERYNSVCNPE